MADLWEEEIEHPFMRGCPRRGCRARHVGISGAIAISIEK